MAEVQLTIGGRGYRLTCGDGEEEALRGAAALLQSKVAPLLEAHQAVSEPRLLLMAALTLAGELMAQRDGPQKDVLRQDDPLPSDPGLLRQLAERTELLAKRLEEAAATA